LFAEVKRHKPSVIYLPGIETWYHTLSDSVITTFRGLLNALPPTDPVLVLGITDMPPDKVSQEMLRDLFGFSKKNKFTIARPSQVCLAHTAFLVMLTQFSNTDKNSFPPSSST
jgi:SpoVK/Ycf46/Vps4 family AAA+-type ATPase